MIISILGLVGKKDSKNNLKSAYYYASNIDKIDGSYYNSTHFLLKNYQDEKFYFLGTHKAIAYQKDLLELNKNNITLEEIEDNDLEDIYEKVYNIISNSKEQVILDVTHGFRHQPISAIFAATLNKFLHNGVNLKIIFAKQIVAFEKYEYIYLDNYIDITELSLLLTGFIRTYNFIPVSTMKLIDAKSFEAFSKALLSNDILGVTKAAQELIFQVEKMLLSKDLTHIEKLLLQVKEILDNFKDFDTLKDYEKYLILADMTTDKNYLVVALTYLFESLREYSADRFKPLIEKSDFKNDYLKNTTVMDTISNFKRSGKTNTIQKKYPQIFNKNRSNFSRIKTIYNEIRELRNSLAHINKDKEFEDIKQEINRMIFKTKTLYKDDILKNIKH